MNSAVPSGVELAAARAASEPPAPGRFSPPPPTPRRAQPLRDDTPGSRRERCRSGIGNDPAGDREDRVALSALAGQGQREKSDGQQPICSKPWSEPSLIPRVLPCLAALDGQHAANTRPVPAHHSLETPEFKQAMLVVRSARRSPPRREAGTSVCQQVGAVLEAQALPFPQSPEIPAGKFQILFKLIVSPAGKNRPPGSATPHVALTKSPMRKLHSHGLFPPR